jgi:tripartite-type tricarboxylate transporter receptor subunit TctC
MKTRTLVFCAAAIAALAPAMAGAADADFKGKTMRIVIPYDPGGTYDLYGQTFSHYLKKYIPGDPTIILQYMPGAGGAKAMNWAYSIMPRDGTYMFTPLDNTVVNQLLQRKQSKYDARKFNFLGSSNQTNIVLVARTDTGIKSWQDLKKKQFVASATGTVDTGYLAPKLVNGVLGTKIRVVTGYKGSNQAIMAIEQRESDMSAYNWLAWVSREQWFKGDKPFATPILQIGTFKDPDLSDNVPMLGDLVKNPEDKKVVAFVASLGVLGRGLAYPPGVSAELVSTLRKAYDQMNADKTFAADLKKRKLRLIPSTGAQIQNIVNQALKDATPSIVARAEKIIYGK